MSFFYFFYNVLSWNIEKCLQWLLLLSPSQKLQAAPGSSWNSPYLYLFVCAKIFQVVPGATMKFTVSEHAFQELPGVVLSPKEAHGSSSKFLVLIDTLQFSLAWVLLQIQDDVNAIQGTVKAQRQCIKHVWTYCNHPWWNWCWVWKAVDVDMQYVMECKTCWCGCDAKEGLNDTSIARELGYRHRYHHRGSGFSFALKAVWNAIGTKSATYLATMRIYLLPRGGPCFEWDLPSIA